MHTLFATITFLLIDITVESSEDGDLEKPEKCREEDFVHLDADTGSVEQDFSGGFILCLSLTSSSGNCGRWTVPGDTTAFGHQGPPQDSIYSSMSKYTYMSMTAIRGSTTSTRRTRTRTSGHCGRWTAPGGKDAFMHQGPQSNSYA